MKYLLIIVLAFSLTLEAKQKRSYYTIKQFKLENPCPSTGRYKGSCPGYIIDHVNPLACGGADEAYNLQWQTKEDAKMKDSWERKHC